MPICLRDCSAAQAQEQEHRRRLPATNLVLIMIIGGHHLTLPPSIHPSFRHSSRKREKGDRKVQAAKPCCAPVVFPFSIPPLTPPLVIACFISKHGSADGGRCIFNQSLLLFPSSILSPEGPSSSKPGGGAKTGLAG